MMTLSPKPKDGLWTCFESFSFVNSLSAVSDHSTEKHDRSLIKRVISLLFRWAHSRQPPRAAADAICELRNRRTSHEHTHQRRYQCGAKRDGHFQSSRACWRWFSPDGYVLRATLQLLGDLRYVSTTLFLWSNRGIWESKAARFQFGDPNRTWTTRTTTSIEKKILQHCLPHSYKKWGIFDGWM